MFCGSGLLTYFSNFHDNSSKQFRTLTFSHAIKSPIEGTHSRKSSRLCQFRNYGRIIEHAVRILHKLIECAAERKDLSNVRFSPFFSITSADFFCRRRNLFNIVLLLKIAAVFLNCTRMWVGIGNFNGFENKALRFSLGFLTAGNTFW